MDERGVVVVTRRADKTRRLARWRLNGWRPDACHPPTFSRPSSKSSLRLKTTHGTAPFQFSQPYSIPFTTRDYSITLPSCYPIPLSADVCVLLGTWRLRWYR